MSHLICTATRGFGEPIPGAWMIECWSVYSHRWSAHRGYRSQRKARREADRLTRMTGAPHRVTAHRHDARSH